VASRQWHATKSSQSFDDFLSSEEDVPGAAIYGAGLMSLTRAPNKQQQYKRDET
jgi:hypothetical protein